VALVLDDPRKIPYLFVWKRPEDSSVREVVLVFAYSEPLREFPVNWTGWAELKPPMEHEISFAPCYDLYHEMGASARLLICPYYKVPRRGLYGWELEDITLRA
jgi:hypothetical protein